MYSPPDPSLNFSRQYLHLHICKCEQYQWQSFMLDSPQSTVQIIRKSPNL